MEDIWWFPWTKTNYTVSPTTRKDLVPQKLTSQCPVDCWLLPSAEVRHSRGPVGLHQPRPLSVPHSARRHRTESPAPRRMFWIGRGWVALGVRGEAGAPVLCLERAAAPGMACPRSHLRHSEVNKSKVMWVTSYAVLCDHVPAKWGRVARDIPQRRRRDTLWPSNGHSYFSRTASSFFFFLPFLLGSFFLDKCIQSTEIFFPDLGETKDKSTSHHILHQPVCWALLKVSRWSSFVVWSGGGGSFKHAA